MIQAPNEASAYTEGKLAHRTVVHWPVHVVALRRRLGGGQQVFADRFGLSVGTGRD